MLYCIFIYLYIIFSQLLCEQHNAHTVTISTTWNDGSVSLREVGVQILSTLRKIVICPGQSLSNDSFCIPPMLFSALCLDCEDTGWEEKGECSFFLGWSQRPVELWRAREILLISIYGQVVKKFCFYCPLERGRIQQMFYTLSCFWIHAIPFLWFLSAQFLPIWTEAIEIFHWCVSMVGLPMSPPLL